MYITRNFCTTSRAGYNRRHRGTVSLLFEVGKHKRVTVKIVDDRGIESLKVIEIE